MANDNETVHEVCAEMRYDHLIKPEMIIARILAAYERDMAAKDAEIAKHERCYHALELHCKKLEDEYLKAMAALKPVMNINLDGLHEYDDIDYGNLLSSVIAEAQRIMKEGEA